MNKARAKTDKPTMQKVEVEAKREAYWKEMQRLKEMRTAVRKGMNRS